jgi:hypothetical protein
VTFADRQQIYATLVHIPQLGRVWLRLPFQGLRSVTICQTLAGDEVNPLHGQTVGQK